MNNKIVDDNLLKMIQYYQDRDEHKIHLKGYIYDSLVYLYQLALYKASLKDAEDIMIKEKNITKKDAEAKARQNYNRDLMKFCQILDEAMGSHDLMEEVKRTERGWAGHYCCSRDCAFRRNTLLEYKNKKWVISTVGVQICRYNVLSYCKKGDIMPIGANRWYETMAFESFYDDYCDADTSKEIEFNSEWGIWGKTWEEVMEKYNQYPDLAANEMHEKVVEELIEKIKEEN